ncbi:MAG: hypothetical protein QGD90_10735, partial [Candidatus Hydrogenedentes bacterium]|nr:hypothetical protein [Candidatus Hydrogenedentota bacterium]
MRILIECGVGRTGKRGITLLQENLIHQLGRIDRENDYYIFCHFFTDYKRRVKEWFDFVPRQSNFHLCIRRWPERAVRLLDKFGIRVIDRHFRSLGIDLIHNFGFT